MVYPVKLQVRYSTVLVIVLVLMSSVLYEVTRTESNGRQSAARTQDISLPAPQPVVHMIRARTDYLGTSSVHTSAITPHQPDQELIATAGIGAVTAVAASARADNPGRGNAFAWGHANREARAYSSGSAGFANPGMNGVGAWGGVSGVVRPVSLAKGEKSEKEPKVKAAAAPKKPGNGNHNGNGNGGGAAAGPDLLLAGGFTTGAAAVEPGAVIAVQTPGTLASVSPQAQAPAPAATPEPMSIMLVGTGLVALVGARRRLQ